MSLFKSNTGLLSASPYLTVACEAEAQISGRPAFKTQNFEYQEKDDDNNSIGFIARDYENGFNDSKRGMTVTFKKDIKPGTYSPGDANFPFETFEYYESAANKDLTQFINYRAVNGTVTVAKTENSSHVSHYDISFEIKGAHAVGGELSIKGHLDLSVFSFNF